MRLIDADALMEQVKAIHNAVDTSQINQAYNTGFHSATSQMQGLIDYMPTIEAKPVVHGEWVRLNEHSFRPVCSECGYYGSAIDAPVNPFNFCPNCGADMRERNTLHEKLE